MESNTVINQFQLAQLCRSGKCQIGQKAPGRMSGVLWIRMTAQ